jgi:hypothetical protein
MPYFTPAKGLLDIPALWGHKLKPNMPLLDRPRIIPREPIQVIWDNAPLDAMWFWSTHTTITPKRHQIRDKVLTFRFCLAAYRYGFPNRSYVAMRLRYLYCCRPTRRFSDASNASHASIPAATSLHSEKALGLAPLLVHGTNQLHLREV